MQKKQSENEILEKLFNEEVKLNEQQASDIHNEAYGPPYSFWAPIWDNNNDNAHNNTMASKTLQTTTYNII